MCRWQVGLSAFIQHIRDARVDALIHILPDVIKARVHMHVFAGPSIQKSIACFINPVFFDNASSLGWLKFALLFAVEMTRGNMNCSATDRHKRRTLCVVSPAREHNLQHRVITLSHFRFIKDDTKAEKKLAEFTDDRFHLIFAEKVLFDGDGKHPYVSAAILAANARTGA